MISGVRSESRRIVALVANPATHDARVAKQAETLAAHGYDVVVLAAQSAHAPETERRNGVSYRRIPIPWADVYGTILRKGIGGTPIFAAPYFVAALFILPFLPLVALRRSAGLVRWLKQVRGDTASARPGNPNSPGRPIVSGVARLYTHHLMRLVMPVVHCERYLQAASTAIEALQPDAIHAHDLDTLPGAVLIGKKLGVPVVYDAHELETDRIDRPGWPSRLLASMLEKRGLRHVAGVITVSEGIAQHMARAYGIPQPRIVLNSPVVAHVERQPAEGLRAKLALPSTTPLAAYVGLVTFQRGIERMIDALPYVGGVHLALVGPKEPDAVKAFWERARVRGVLDRVHLVDPVPPEEVAVFVRSADVGLLTLPATCLSYVYAMPNKLFELVLSGVPVIVGHGAMRHFVEVNGVGLAVDPGDPRAIADALGKVVAQPRRFRPTSAKLAELRAAYGWEAQARVLVSLYLELWQDKAVQ